MKLVIIDYGTGNIKSIQLAFKRLGVDAILTSNISAIQSADRIIFPGVGEASSAMRMLKSKKLDCIIPNLTQPVLGICLGMQLMCNYTEEGETEGLGIFDVKVRHFNKVVKVPQIGWNTINNLKSELFVGINENEYMYSVHSYYAENCKETIANSVYHIGFSAALHKNNFYGVQFHPEKSSAKGEQLLKNFMKL